MTKANATTKAKPAKSATLKVTKTKSGVNLKITRPTESKVGKANATTKAKPAKAAKLVTPAPTFSKGMRVEIIGDDHSGERGEITKLMRGGVVMVASDDGEKRSVKTACIRELHRGRKALLVSLSDKELHAEIKQLMDELTSCDDHDEKKRLRRMLRRRGHQGGLGVRKSLEEMAKA